MYKMVLIVSFSVYYLPPISDCSDSYILSSAGTITFHTDASKFPQWYDCVWTVKKVMSGYPDGVTIRLAEVRLGEGTYHISHIKYLHGHLHARVSDALVN